MSGSKLGFASSRRRSEAQATLLAGAESDRTEPLERPDDRNGSDAVADESGIASVSDLVVNEGRR